MQSEDFGTYHVTYRSIGGKTEATVKIVKKSKDLEIYVYVLFSVAGLIFISLISILLTLLLRKLHREKI